MQPIIYYCKRDCYNFDVLLTVHFSITLFLYFVMCLLQSSTRFEQRRAHHQEVNCINRASGTVTLCKWPSGAEVEMYHTGLLTACEQEQMLLLTSCQQTFMTHLNLCTGRPPTESDYTRCCINTILPPDDEHDVARNM